MEYKLLDHLYYNTGGYCMVSRFTLYDEENNRTLFLLMNEEGGTLATVDYLEYDGVDYTKVMLDSFSVEKLEPSNKHFELYRHCMIEYFRKDCAEFKYHVKLPYYLLPDELQRQLTPEDVDHYIKKYGDLFETNCYSLY